MTAQDILKQYFGYDSFRPGQDELVRAILSGRDTLGIMPTGAGKSICYQVPAMLFPGLTLVISPLISLMKDQVGALVEAGVPAACINSAMSAEEFRDALYFAGRGQYKLLYVAPERLTAPSFLEFAKRVPISMVTVDEAHCISQWGQDFRPSYLKILDFLAELPERPLVSAFTATATAEVRDDIVQALGLHEPFIKTTGFDRPNLYFAVEQPTSKGMKLLQLLNERKDKSGIVYCSTRKNVEEICDLLLSRGLPATRYHAGLDPDERRENQDDFLYDRKTIMVATNAFGMGIDKPDVRLVVHIDMPDSPEAYFQEAGRAGRDGLKAYAVLLYAKTDKGIMSKRIADTFPEKDYIRKVYEQINYYYQMAMGDGLGCTKAFNIDEFCRNFKHFPIQVDSALKILTRAGYLEYTDEQDNASRRAVLHQRERPRHGETYPRDTAFVHRAVQRLCLHRRRYTGQTQRTYTAAGVQHTHHPNPTARTALHPRQKDTLYYIHARTPRQRPHSTKQRGVRRP